jgi:diguanylate cyclase (GGDEF)-like protein
MRPAIPFTLVLLLLIGTSSVIFYVERTLSEIEEALPITLSKQERDIRVLVSDMGTLVQSIGIARTNQAPGNFSIVLRQIDEMQQHLEVIRESYRFNDVLRASAIHAKLNPAIFDINTWLTKGLYNFEPTSAQTLKISEMRAKEAHAEAEVLLLQVGKTAIDVLTAQADRIDAFRNIMILTLAILTIMTVGLVMLGFRLQKSVLALKDSEEQIRYRANFDSLTDLPNRLNFIEHLSEAVSRSRRNPGHTALMFIDLDRFKTINDTLGHDFGDELIRQVAIRIGEVIRETDLVSRLGGDEFTVLLPDMTDEIHASILAKNILASLAEPFMLYGHEVYSSASIGITMSPDDGEDANTLLKNAFLELDKDMRRALAQNELEVYFQPIYELSKHSPIGVEALLRWQHPKRGLILPAEFIPVAEETGLIEEIGLWVLRRACIEGLAWLDQDLHPSFYLAVNISMRQFKGGLDKKQMQQILQETGFPADKLLLEITESLLMDDDIRIKDVLAEFRRMGIRLAVDDFGTGYSALSYLREFPVSTLKIDRSFIQDIGASSSHRRLVEAIITMAHGLDLMTIAEGVETSEQDALLSELHCDMGQGYYYCKPVTADNIKHLTSNKKPRLVLFDPAKKSTKI